ncbi:MAG: diguanylate cyclase [Pseudomonadota bacterium]
MSKRHAAAVREPLKSSSKPRTVETQVSFRTRRLETTLMGALVAFTFWACAVLTPGDLIVWMIAVYAGAIAAWCRFRPALQEWTMFLRATLLMAGAFVLQTSGDGADAGGPYFVWPLMIVAMYSLMLSDRWITLLWSVAALEFVAARVFDHASSWQLTLMQAGALMFFAYAGREFGHSIRHMDRESEQLRKDPNSRLYNEMGFFDHGAQLFDECRGRKRPFTLVLLNSADLREVSDLAGKKAANHLFKQLVDRIESATAGEGLAARTDSVEFALALPGVTGVRAAQLLQQHLGNPPKVEVVLKGSRVTVMLDSLIAEATPDVPTLEDMYDRMRAKLMRRAGEVVSRPAEAQSTLQGMLESDSVLPHHARPTMPMVYPQGS